MGCCKSRGGFLGGKEEDKDLQHVPEKYRSAVKSKNSKELMKMFNEELDEVADMSKVDAMMD